MDIAAGQEVKTGETLCVIEAMKMQNIIRAERDGKIASLGANPFTVIWRVTLPAMRSGIIAGALFAFVFSFENLELALFLTSPGVTTLPVAVLQYLEYHIDPLVSAVAVVQTVGIAALLLVLDRFMRLGRIVR